MWVKICANTNVDDAQLAASFGADAVGFVFAPSKRQVSVEQVAAITSQLPSSVEKVGVFDTTVFDEVVEGVRRAGLTMAQLHSAYQPELVARLHAQGIPIFQTMHWQTDLSAEDQIRTFAETAAAIDRQGFARAVLVDSRTPKAAGGTGIAFRWSDAAAVLGRMKTPVLVAGGLHPENVVEAIQTLHPWGVDVATGVERAPGQKDPEKLRSFLVRAKEARVSLV